MYSHRRLTDNEEACRSIIFEFEVKAFFFRGVADGMSSVLSSGMLGIQSLSRSVRPLNDSFKMIC
jgi:hypothetical protein